MHWSKYWQIEYESIFWQVKDRDDEEQHVHDLHETYQDLTLSETIVSTDEIDDIDAKNTDESQDEDALDSENSEMNAEIEERFSSRFTKEGSFAYMWYTKMGHGWCSVSTL